jgi:hypothetical protein
MVLSIKIDLTLYLLIVFFLFGYIIYRYALMCNLPEECVDLIQTDNRTVCLGMQIKKCICCKTRNFTSAFFFLIIIMFDKNQFNSLSSRKKNRLSTTLNWFNQIFSRFIRQCCIILPDENDSLSSNQIK